MKKYLLILAIVSLSLFLVSCQQGGSSSKETNYMTGVKDINLKYIGDETAYEERPLNLFMSLNNKLAYDAEGVRVSVVGLDEAYVDLQDREEAVGLMQGQSVFNPEGETKNIRFSGGIKKLPPGADKIDQNYFVYIDYFSKMIFNPTICIGPVLYGVENGGCKGSNSDGRSQKLSYSGQGAPLAVTNLEVVSGDGQVELRLILKNLGKGDMEDVSISQADLGGKKISCKYVNSAGDTFTFTQEKNEADVICEAVVSRSSTYETPLQMEFLYKYRLKIKQQLELRGSGAGSSGFIS